MNWREKIEAQIAELRRNGVAMHFHAADTLQALLDDHIAMREALNAIAAPDPAGAMTKKRYEALASITVARLSIDKLREVE